jgi:hypothetical protein
MKKLLFLLVLTASLLSAQSYERNILIEVLTNSHCPLCPGAHNAIDAYLSGSANSSRVNYIFYHMPFPYSDDSLNLANPSDASARNNYYGPFSSTPRGIFDGTVEANNYSQWASLLESRLAVQSPVQIGLSGSRDGFNITINANVTFGIGSESSVIHLVVVEDVNYSGRNGIRNHKNVMRKIITPAEGETISNSGTQDYTKTFQLDQSWNSNNVSVVVFLQNPETKEVYQSATIDYNDLIVTDIAETNQLPNDFELRQNYPNPFNPTTTIEYSLPSSGYVHLNVYNLFGQEVAALVNDLKPAGTHKVQFNAAELPSGIYFYKVDFDGSSKIRKLLLLK